MSDTELAELEAKERAAWHKVEEAKKVLDPLEKVWLPIHQELQKARLRREIEREMENK